MMIEAIPTAFIFFAAAALILILPKGLARNIVMLGTPILSAVLVWNTGLGNFAQIPFFGFELEFMRLDKLSRIFVLIFCLAAFLGNLFAWHLRDSLQQVAALAYAGSAIGAAQAGDMITLFFYWEGTAIASVFLIWARGTAGAYATGMRYLIIQIASGVILIAGVAVFFAETGTITFDKMELASLGTWLIFISFGMKCAFPLLHNWLQDSYPAATITGTVILSAFTTKLAVYALARGFAGTEILIYIGTVMTLFPIFFAEIENDLRRVLAYSLNNQLGFMVVGVGIGTEMALNGTASHAFAHILYKALLFMSVGAVMFRTGTSKASELGGLYRTMPLTAVFCLIGAASISAFPLFSGFVTKSLTLTAVAEEHKLIIWLCLVFASAGVLSHSGIKIPFFTFFAHDSGMRPKEAPRHMLWAMGITAFLCIAIGVYPDPLYALLPYDLDYHPYTMDHVVAQLQLLFFALLAFAVIFRAGLHPPEIRAVNMDSDVIYRKFTPSVMRYLAFVVAALFRGVTGMINRSAARLVHRLHHSHGPDGSRAASWPAGAMVMSIAALLGLALLVIFFS
ncbi:Na(+)/H(+) antiporter subunit D [Amylibacter marinus]|uniref:Na(+)/H(+) antiporter subunit D n=1 Tax=Amylibacter marinus TaxID=1475483 RepID=A0ABQ5VYE0_9RHOB|nr:Na(+)/H(+) antiporter subunit D [Amylibacter marinus]GLQ36261.1 Na(+)/H(+) antiporter subunit D [Amylibacter marinus]